MKNEKNNFEENIIDEALKAYKDEFIFSPSEYVHGDYRSFLSDRIRIALNQQRQQIREEILEHSKKVYTTDNVAFVIVDILTLLPSLNTNDDE